MLVLSRKAGQSIMVGKVSVSVLRVCGHVVRLGIEAPRDVPVSRQERLIRPDRDLPATGADGAAAAPGVSTPLCPAPSPDGPCVDEGAPS